MNNEKLIFITGPVGCGKSEKGGMFREFYGCVAVFDGADAGMIRHAIETQPGPFLVLTSAPAKVLLELFPGSRVFHYVEACKAVGVSPFHDARGRINPAIAGAALSALPEALQTQVKMAPRLYAVLEEITKERGKQVGKGFDSSHDDRYTGNELPQAAIAYTLNAALPQAHVDCPFFWPWAVQYFKPEGRRADMIKAAALLVAEIERMDRAIAAKTSGMIDSWEPGDAYRKMAGDLEENGDL